MNRPTQRPAKPYTRSQILKMVYTHFVLDRSPKATAPNSAACVYNGTGCAVGCMLVKQDAEQWSGAITSIADKTSGHSCLNAYKKYFGKGKATLNLLSALQHLHDRHADKETFTSHMMFGIENFSTILGYGTKPMQEAIEERTKNAKTNTKTS